MSGGGVLLERRNGVSYDGMIMEEIQFDTKIPKVAVQELTEHFEGLQVILGEVVQMMEELVILMTPQAEGPFDSLIGGADAFNSLADGRRNLEEIFGLLNKGLESAGGSFRDLDIFQALLSQTDTFATTFNTKVMNIVGAFDGIGTAFSGTTMIWIAAIGAVIAAVVLLVQNWDTVKAGLVAGWEAVKTAFGAAMEWIGGVVQSGIGVVQGVFQSVDDFLQNVFAVSWSEKFGFFGGVLDAFFANVENIWNAVKTVFQGVVQFVSSVFAGDWKGAWDGIVTIFTGIWDGIVAYLKIPINAAIGVLNGFLNHVETIVNAVIGLLNGISVEVPDWEIFGDLAGKAFGFQLAPVALPRIPLLAKGAVLPANRPFLAMVGDQRHGTNVEAPLATIQEAVALVMGDQVAAMMAGFREVVREQQALRAAVEGIEVGDEVIGRAAVRYGERMAVVKGS